MRKFVTAAIAIVAASVSAVTLENSKVRVEIGEKGELKALVCKETGHDWAGGGALWRLYFDDRRDGSEEKEVPVLGAEQKPEISSCGDKIILNYPSLLCRSKVLDVSLRLSISLDAGGAVRFASELSNREAHTCIRELQYPLVSDVRLASGCELLTTHACGERHPDPIALVNASNSTMPYMGRNWQFRQLHLKYPELTAANCFALFTERQGLYFGCHDILHRDTWHGLRTYPDGKGAFSRLEAGLYKFPHTVAGGVWKDDTHVVFPYAGTWHVTADTYRRWADTWWRQRRVPNWVRAMPGWQRVIFRHQYGITYYTPHDINGKIREAGSAAGINALLAFGWWKAGMDNGYPDSYFECEPSHGGDEAWRREIAVFKANGGRFLQYFNGKLIDLASDYWKSGKGKDVCYRDNIGEVFTEHYRFRGPGTFTGHWNSRLFTVADQRKEEWRVMQRRFVDRALDFGADAVFFDQMGYAEDSCNWDTSGQFAIPCQSVIADKAESLRRIHDYLDEKGNPEIALGTELFADVCAQHVDFVHNIYGSGRPSFFLDWIRYAFPEVVLSDREIRDDTDVERRLNLNLLVGLRSDVEIYRCQGLVSMTPKYQAYLGKVNRLRRKYPVLLATYRDTLGFSNSSPKLLNARLFTDGETVAVVVAAFGSQPGVGVINVKGRRFADCDGIGSFHVKEADSGVHVELGENALAVVVFK